MIRRCTVPDICCTTDVIIFDFGLFFCLLHSKQPKKSKLYKNEKKTPGDNIILHKCTKNHDPMQYCSWDMVHDWCDCYFSFWTISYHFIPPNSPKNQNFKKMKKKKTFGDIITLHECTKNHIICYTVPEIWQMTVVIIFHFEPLWMSNFYWPIT